MYNIIKRIILIFTASLLLVSCEKNAVKIKTSINSYETDNEIVYIELPKISGLKDEKFEDELNSEYEKRYEEMLNSYLDSSEKTKSERNKKSELIVKQRVSYNKNNLVSIISESYKYTDGFNGQSVRYVNNIDTKNNKKLLLSDIFNDDGYKEMLNQRLEKISLDEKYSDLWERPKIGEKQNEYFYFTDKGLVVFYPPYELSYYSRGFVEFTIPYENLYGYLNPEYSVLY